MQGNYSSAIAHVHSGVKILCEIEYNEHSGIYQHEVLQTSAIPYVPIAKLKALFTRLDSQVTEVRANVA